MDKRSCAAVCAGLGTAALFVIPTSMAVLSAPGRLERMFSGYSGIFFAGQLSGALYLFAGLAAGYLISHSRLPEAETSSRGGAHFVAAAYAPAACASATDNLRSAQHEVLQTNTAPEPKKARTAQQTRISQLVPIKEVKPKKGVPMIARGPAFEGSFATKIIPAVKTVSAAKVELGAKAPADMTQPLYIPEPVVIKPVSYDRTAIPEDIKVDLSFCDDFFGDDLLSEVEPVFFDAVVPESPAVPKPEESVSVLPTQRASFSLPAIDSSLELSLPAVSDSSAADSFDSASHISRIVAEEMEKLSGTGKFPQQKGLVMIEGDTHPFRVPPVLSRPSHAYTPRHMSSSGELMAQEA